MNVNTSQEQQSRGTPWSVRSPLLPDDLGPPLTLTVGPGPGCCVTTDPCWYWALLLVRQQALRGDSAEKRVGAERSGTLTNQKHKARTSTLDTPKYLSHVTPAVRLGDRLHLHSNETMNRPLARAPEYISSGRVTAPYFEVFGEKNCRQGVPCIIRHPRPPKDLNPTFIRARRDLRRVAAR